MTPAVESSACRRTYIRLRYAPGRRPGLRVADARFDVIDISESGLRFHNPHHLPLPPSFRGRITLLGGGAIDIAADIEWQENDEVGASLAELIPPEVLKNEQRRTILGAF